LDSIVLWILLQPPSPMSYGKDALAEEVALIQVYYTIGLEAGQVTVRIQWKGYIYKPEPASYTQHPL
jgi:hypothetical protein